MCLCGFCLNTGRVQGVTGMGAEINGKPCICKNGRCMKAAAEKIDKKRGEVQ